MFVDTDHRGEGEPYEPHLAQEHSKFGQGLALGLPLSLSMWAATLGWLAGMKPESAIICFGVSKISFGAAVLVLAVFWWTDKFK